ncbi:tRNA (guanine(37)-N(1))-methyltransferase, partial [Paenibacillus apiarius]|nr:tRNA (guanine(37)-N(1))-methyltransferase [Paenibacillus apiarius]
MRIDVLTLFPEMCEGVFNASILGKAREKGL